MTNEKFKPNFSKLGGLISVIVEDESDKSLLMNAFMNEEAWKKTLETRLATYWSREKQKIWVKGEESGNYQKVKEIYIDCDADSMRLVVKQIGGAACHKGYKSCFFRKLNLETGELEEISKKVFNPNEVYKK